MEFIPIFAEEVKVLVNLLAESIEDAMLLERINNRVEFVDLLAGYLSSAEFLNARYTFTTVSLHSIYYLG